MLRSSTLMFLLLGATSGAWIISFLFIGQYDVFFLFVVFGACF